LSETAQILAKTAKRDLFAPEIALTGQAAVRLTIFP
jgi:hypothetical protein